MKSEGETERRIAEIAERLAPLGDNIVDWEDEDYVHEPGSGDERWIMQYLVSTDHGTAPEPDIIAAEIPTREIARFIAHAPRDIQFLLAEMDRLSAS